MEASGRRALIVDDHPGVAKALTHALTFDGRITVVGSARSVEQGLGLADGADVIVLDLHLPDHSGLDAVRAFQERFPKKPIVVYSAAEDKELLDAVRGYVSAVIQKGAVDPLLGALLDPSLLDGMSD